MFKGQIDHIVFACKSIFEIRHFYEEVIGLLPNTISEQYVTYNIGSFALCFKELADSSDVGVAVIHIGIDFQSRSDVDLYFEKIRASDYAAKPERIIGGSGLGPYRFYVKDPAGYALEFESWEGCSN